MRRVRACRSFGKVYQGWWRGGTVAIKVVPHEGDLGEKVEIVRESLLSSSIQHPQIVSGSACEGSPLIPYCLFKELPDALGRLCIRQLACLSVAAAQAHVQHNLHYKHGLPSLSGQVLTWHLR